MLRNIFNKTKPLRKIACATCDGNQNHTIFHKYQIRLRQQWNYVFMFIEVVL